MTKSIRRDNEYYLERLRVERPDLHRDLASGRIANPAAAFKLAGFKKSRTRLQEMTNAWSKASSSERDEFKSLIGCAATVVSPAPATTPFSVGRRLSPRAVSEITAIINGRAMRMGDVMRELGFKPLNQSLARALQLGTMLQPDVIAAAEKWVHRHIAVIKPP